MDYKKQVEKIVLSIKTHKLVQTETLVLEFLRNILKKFPTKPNRGQARKEYRSVQLLYLTFDETFFPLTGMPEKSSLFDQIHLQVSDSSWIERRPKNYYLLACCRNPNLMDKILREILNYLLPEEPWYFSQKTLLETIEDYKTWGWSDRLIKGAPYHK
ncbi:hypothetical protein M1555_04390 [Patescibacteria group bacterium]|nr:hypothetical protein [Patescibacteria group bacterium]